MLSYLSYQRFSSSNLLKCKAGLLCRESALFHYTYTKSYQINFAPLHGLLKSKSKSKIGIADPVEEIYHQGQLDQKTRCHDCLCAGRAWYDTPHYLDCQKYMKKIGAHRQSHFDIPFLIQSHAERMKKILEALQDLPANQHTQSSPISQIMT